MAKNLQQSGMVVTVAAPAGGVVSGEAFLVQTTLCVALSDAAATEDVEVAIEGVYKSIPADNSTAFANLAPLFWDTDNDQLVNDPAGPESAVYSYVGRCIGGKLSAAATCAIKLA